MKPSTEQTILDIAEMLSQVKSGDYEKKLIYKNAKVWGVSWTNDHWKVYAVLNDNGSVQIGYSQSNRLTIIQQIWVNKSTAQSLGFTCKGN